MRVLVIDDEQDVVLLCRLKLEAAGHEVRSAGNGREGVAAARSSPPDVILLDVMLPELDGFGVLEELRSSPSTASVPVIMISARVAQADRDRASDAGAAAYLAKPFLPDELVRLVVEVAASGQAGGDAPVPSTAGAGGGAAAGAETEAMATSTPWAGRDIGLLLDLAVDAIVAVDAHQRIVSFNRGAETVFGYVQEEVLGKPLDMLVPDELASGHRAHVEHFAGESHSARQMGERRDIRGRRKDGSDFPAEASIVKLEVDGEPVLAAILRDATQREATEAELRAHALRQSSIARFAQQAIATASLSDLFDETATLVSDVLAADGAEVLRLRPGADEFVTVASTFATGGDSAAATASLAGDAVRRGVPMVVDDLQALGLSVRTEHGPAGSAVAVVIPGAPRPYGVINVYATRSRAFRSEDAQFVDALASVLAGAIQRTRTEERFRRFLEAAPDAIIVVDRYGRLVSANAQAEVLFGYRQDELVGASVEMLVPDHVRDIHARHRNEYVREPRVRPMGAGNGLVARRQDGREVPVDIMLSPLDVDDDRLVIAAIRDVTERRRVEAIRDSFLHAVSHELRTPLTTVLGFASLLANDLDTLAAPQIQQLAGRLLTNAQRLERLLTDLLDLDRLARGVVDPRRRATDLVELAQGVVRTLGLEGHHVVVEGPAEGEKLIAAIDPAQVERIVENLLVNVARHCPPGSTATVRVGESRNGVLLGVDDEGPGVPADLKAAIFEPFRRGRDTHAPGTGIGLSLVARFAELHGGRAWVEDRAGGGASFRVLLADGASAAAEVVP